MKKIYIIFILLFILLPLTSCDTTKKPYDKIHEYKIIVNPNNDGTLNMEYYLKWEVLEEGSSGVDFITVGVANRFVENVLGLTDNIKDIYYSSDNGSTIRIDFKNTYHQGEMFEVRFSLTQKRIFTLKNNEVQYSFTPGWFEEIQVEHLTVLWNSNNVLKNNTDKNDGNYLRWDSKLDYGETIETNLVYSKDSFPNLNPKEDYSTQTENPLLIIGLIGFIVCFILIVIIISNINCDKYQTCRGFSGRINHYHVYFGHYHGYHRSGKKITPPNVNNKGSGVNGSGCACACACACAGGGRAGCSRKDFNNYLEV